MYQAFYRKWRPRTFADVCDQETVTAALQNEVRTGRLSHAYLFTGCRGTGKTTCAKILAKAVNCLQPTGGDPCNQCVLCRGIDDGSVLDVTEIDAASNNGVDSIRELRDEVAFTPVSGKYRVYIIDEVHMLSAGAFNALLKTLEEPPAHVIFILATTEVHKIPATILSRCQRFDFNRIRPAAIAARLQYVAQEEGLTLTPEAGMLLARLADGALRDGLSLLDQCASVARDIDVDTVTAVTGMAGQEVLAQLTLCVAEGDGAGALSRIDALYQSAKDMERLCAEWVTYMRNLMILHSMEAPGELVVATPGELEQMKQMTSRLGLATILHILEVLQSTLDRLRGGVSRRVEMEMAVLRLCDPALDSGTAPLVRRLEALEARVAAGVPSVAAVPQPSVAAPVFAPPAEAEMPPAPPAEALDQPASLPEPPAAPLPDATAAESGEQPFPQWAAVLEQLLHTCPPLYGVLMGSSAILKDGKLLICTDNPLFKDLLKDTNNQKRLTEAVQAGTGTSYRLGLRRVQTVNRQETDPLTQLLNTGRAAGVTVNEE